MENNIGDVLHRLAFKTQGYRKNFDLITHNENIITEYVGTISMLRINESQPPLIIGEYGISVWNIELGRITNINLKKLMKEYDMENAYLEMTGLIEDKKFDIHNYKKIVFIHGLIVHPDYRKLGVTEEFIEFVYRDFYNDSTAIIALVKPIQDNTIDADFYFRHKMVNVRNNVGEFDSYDVIPAIEYYSLDKLMENKDREMNEYKIFTIAQKCGFNRLEYSYLFLYNPKITINRILHKQF
jgi:GNAT superfamily N-acetyltransferase